MSEEINLGARLRELTEAEIRKSPAQVAREVEDTYPHITLEDAQRIRDGLKALITATDKADQKKRERSYIALHAELKRKYRKSGR